MSDVNIRICLNICIANDLLAVIGDVHDPGNQFLAFFISSPALTRGVPCRVTMESITPSRVENKLHDLSSGSTFSPAVPSRISKRRPVPENPADTQVISGNSLRMEVASALQLIFFWIPETDPLLFSESSSAGVWDLKYFPNFNVPHSA